jgi:hypothetical protein
MEATFDKILSDNPTNPQPHFAGVFCFRQKKAAGEPPTDCKTFNQPIMEGSNKDKKIHSIENRKKTTFFGKIVLRGVTRGVTQQKTHC